jgi:hypothetical protein
MLASTARSPHQDEPHPASQHQVSASSISLPKGGGAIRGIGGKFAANSVSGTGSMTVPIVTSPGRPGSEVGSTAPSVQPAGIIFVPLGSGGARLPGDQRSLCVVPVVHHAPTHRCPPHTNGLVPSIPPGFIQLPGGTASGAGQRRTVEEYSSIALPLAHATAGGWNERR